MKITAIVVAYNESLFVDYSIRSIYSFVDEIVIVDCAIQSAVDVGYSATSTDGTRDIINKYVDNKKVFLAPNPSSLPLTHKECFNIGFQLAKSRNADWIFFVPADEVWPSSSLVPLRNFLKQCDKNGVLGLNVWMHMFAPDFWHHKDFRNPRFSKVTADAVLADDVTLYYPSRRVWQYAGDLNHSYPPGTPLEVQKINSDYPRNLRAFHYSCVGEERVKFKAEFWKRHNGTCGDKYVESYMNKDWENFYKLGFNKFNGKHPKIMEEHPLFGEKIF